VCNTIDQAKALLEECLALQKARGYYRQID